MSERNISRDEQRDLIRQKIQKNNAEGKEYYVIPAADNAALIDTSKPKRVCAYCRVSTDDPAQTTSYELQKKFYEEEISKTQGWIFAGIYADEGISATSLKNRDEFNRMISDCYAGKIDLIVTKNVSRFARNVVDCLSVVRKLAQLNPPVGVKFENEGFYSLDATSELLLTVLAASAQEESKTKSNSMNWSLEKRFDNFDFLTPVLLGYDHDADGNLIVNPVEANTVKLMYYSYLAGFSLKETAKLLNELGRPSKKGNIKWKPDGVRQILRNERYCGDVLSWKTYTYDFWEHKKRKNRQNRKQIRQNNHHEAIVSREVFEAVQIKMELDKYTRDPHNFPTINVIDEGMLQGFVSINRSCRGFTKEDYCGASESIYIRDNRDESALEPGKEKGYNSSFDLDGYEIVRAEFFTTYEKPTMKISNNRISFNTMCLKKFENVEYVELLINTVEKCIAIRPCDVDNPNAFRWGKFEDDKWQPLPKSITGFAAPLFAITGWDPSDRVKLCGQYMSDGETQVLFFDLSEPEIIRMVTDEAADSDGHMNDAADRDADHPVAEGYSEEPEAVEEARLEKVLPDRWKESFGNNLKERRTCFLERIRYKGDWEVLRPARQYSIAGNVSQAVLDEVKRETRRIIEDMRQAV